MLHNIGKRIEEDKNNMLLLQLIINGVKDEKILDAFSKVDRNDFVPKQLSRMAYQDMEINFAGTKRSMLRPIILAKIVSYILDLAPNKLLIVGDISGYTCAILSNMFQSITAAMVSNSDFETFSKNLQDITEIKSIESIFSNKKPVFDLVFLDSGFYSFSTIKKALNIISREGSVIYLSKKSSFDFSLSKFNFLNADICCLKNSKTTHLFSENMFIAEEFVL